jgi:DNA-binding transcriptional LysR family regulator
VAHEARSWQTRLGLVAAGLGASVLPGLAADTLPHGVKWLRVRDPALVKKRDTVLVTAADRSPGASALARAMHDEMTRFVADPASTP